MEFNVDALYAYRRPHIIQTPTVDEIRSCQRLESACYESSRTFYLSVNRTLEFVHQLYRTQALAFIDSDGLVRLSEDLRSALNKLWCQDANLSISQESCSFEYNLSSLCGRIEATCFTQLLKKLYYNDLNETPNIPQSYFRFYGDSVNELSRTMDNARRATSGLNYAACDFTATWTSSS